MIICCCEVGFNNVGGLQKIQSMSWYSLLIKRNKVQAKNEEIRFDETIVVLSIE